MVDEAVVPTHGDPARLNTDRTLLDAVGPETLRDVVRDFLDLVGTSCAVYESNGDYALGILSSGWCQALDQASFRLAGGDDLGAALASGRWLCHESCWGRAAKVAVTTGRPLDIACDGGLRIYAVPVLAGDRVVGAISLGYGDAPRGIAALTDLAARFEVPVAELRRLAARHGRRAPVLAEMAKRRVLTAARLFGLMVERLHAERAASQNGARYRSLFTGSPISLWEEDFSKVRRYLDELRASGVADIPAYLRTHPQVVARCAALAHVVDVNPATLRMFGARDLAELQAGLPAVFGPESYQAFTDEMVALAEGQTRFECETTNRTLAGDRLEVTLTWSVVPGCEDTLSRVIVAIVDITGRKEAEQALRESQAFFHDLVETAYGLLWQCDAQGRFEYLNPAWEGVLGYRLEEMLGRRFSEFQTPEQAARDRAVFDRLLAGVSLQDYETVHLRADGSPVYLVYSGKPLVGGDGTVVGIRGTAHDITARKLAEGRTAAALEEKTALLREVHHRVKNNLQTMISLMRMRGAQMADAEARAVLVQLQEQARTMALVHEQLCQAANLAQVRMQPYLEQLARHVLQSWGAGRDVELAVEAGRVVLDAERAMPCGLAVNELVTNALKHAFPPGWGGRPAVRVELRHAAGGYRLRVVDNGVGLPAATNWRQPATMGLHLVQLWATHQMGGSLSVESPPGTAYTVTFEGRQRG